MDMLNFTINLSIIYDTFTTVCETNKNIVALKNFIYIIKICIYEDYFYVGKGV